MLSVLSVFFATTSAHSWVHCTDYRGPKDYFDSNQCFGHVRPIARGPGDIIVPAQVAFGQDQGFNRNNADGNPDFRPFDGKCQSSVTDQMAGGNFPMATYQRGQRVTLAWPAKNHVAAGCTNQFIPDGFVKVFVEPYKNAQGNRFNQEIDGTWRQNPHQNGQIDFRGFQNCPKFCENMDKSLCTGDFTVPNLPDGKYSFQWLWKFNPQDEYVTCFEAEIKGEAPGNPQAMVISTDGCHNNMDEETCVGAVDGRQEFRGEKCAWCCGEFCNKDATGGNGGDNRCEPRRFLEEQAGVTAFKNSDVDQCPQPTISPTAEPSATPTETPTAAPTTEPSAWPTALPSMPPTGMPTQSPVDSMMAPDPVANPGSQAVATATAAAANGGVCAAAMELCKNGPDFETCCESGTQCVALTATLSQCQPVVGATAAPEEESMMPSMESMLILGVLCATFVIICCGGICAYRVYSKGSRNGGEVYFRQDSREDSSSGRRDRHDRSRSHKKKKKRSPDAMSRPKMRNGEPSHNKRSEHSDSYDSYKKTPGNARAPPTPRGDSDAYVSEEETAGRLHRKETPV